MNKLSWVSVIAIFLFSLWVGKDLLSSQFIQSHDGLFHVLRLQQFHLALIEGGQFPVRWAPTLLNGLGYPLFIINYHLPYYLAEIFHLISGSAFTAVKLTLFLSIFASAVTSFFLFRNWSQSTLAAFVGSVFFTLAPYRMANIFERGALGEAVAYIFVPLLFLGVEEIKRHRNLVLFVIGLTGLILSHTVIAIMYLPLAIVWLLITSQNKRKHIQLIAFGIGVAILLGAFQLMPVIFERGYMQFDQNLLNYYQGHYRNIFQILRIPYQGVNLGTSFQLGLAHSLALILGLIFMFRKKANKLNRKFGILAIFTFSSLFMVTNFSSFIWNNFKALSFILYPWRFLGIAAFSASALASLLVARAKKSRVILTALLLFAVSYTSRHYTKADSFIPAKLTTELTSGNGTTQNEFDPVGFSHQAITSSKPFFEPLNAPELIFTSRLAMFKHEIDVKTDIQAQAKLGLLYFPGWEITLDDKPAEFDTNVIFQQNGQEKDLRGLPVITIPKGNHVIKVEYKETLVRTIGNIVTLATLFTGLIINLQVKGRIKNETV